jgi:endonuclease/exonuclease/phosphatase family metal-dependent hydrolase
LIVGVLLPSRHAPVDSTISRGVQVSAVAATIAVLGVVCGWQLLRWEEPEATTPLGSEFTVMSYNIQSGFSVDNDWSLEKTAQTIEAADPDIVVLQEVGRGWLVTTNMDQIAWLARRLNMEFAFGANSLDGLWGNAILSRAPIIDTERHAFDTTQNLARAVLIAEIETESGPLIVMGTHLDNPSGAGNVRLEQAEELLAAWEGRSPAILLGDFNATPETDVLAAFDAAGLRDPGLDLLGDTTTSQDGKRIDYVLTTGEIETLSMDVPDVWTSDHLPVVARLRFSQ